MRLVIYRDSSFPALPPGDKPSAVESHVPFQTIKDWVRDRSVLRRAFSFESVEVRAHRVENIPKPLWVALLLRFLSRGKCAFTDATGARLEITLGVLAMFMVRFAGDLVRAPFLLASLRDECASLETSVGESGADLALDLTRSPLYLRTDLWFGVKSGGSVGHIAGVLNHLDGFAGKPVFLTTDRIPTVREDLENHIIIPPADFFGFAELPTFNFNRVFTAEAERILATRPIAFVYQRYSLNNLSGLVLARRRSVPFVLEFNGSEVWISRNWDRPLRYEALSLRIEDLVLRSAQLVVVVSRPMKGDLVKRGIPEGRILVNPNGVDPDKYSPSVGGSETRRRLGLEGKRVIGFIGTFGRWHGAELLAEAFGRLLAKHPDWKSDVRLLMIGDGLTLPEVKTSLDKNGVRDLAVLTGLVPQAEGPAHLAACDILVNPTVPNADGTPFFGSPTKLFEYMAMGKGIVASDLDQIGEVLAHDKTAWLVKPGDLDSLVAGLERLLGDPEAARRLGLAAREEALAKYTWKSHTGRILAKLKESTGE